MSTGRSGSKYVSQVFNLSGINSAHELYWNAGQWAGQPRPNRPWDLPDATLGEWSAQAVPFLPELPPTVWVFHQVREPLATIASYLHFGLFDDPRRLGLQGMFIIRHAEIPRGGNRIGNAARFYVRWNRRIEETARGRYMRWRVEDVDDPLIRSVGALLSVDADPAVDQVPTDVNSRRRKTTVEWSDIPQPARLPLQEMAERYGYL